MTEAEDWGAFGSFLIEQRKALGLNRRQAAKRAGLAEAAYRELEVGRGASSGPVRLLPHPSDDVLKAVAETLEVPFEEVMAHVPRPYQSRTRERGRPSGEPDVNLGLTRRIAALSDRDRRLVEHLVDRMTAEQD